MGGILIIGYVIISIVVNIVRWVNQLEFVESAFIPLAVMVAYSILGGIDDYQVSDNDPASVCWHASKSGFS